MAGLKLILIGALCMLFIPDVSGMECNLGGIPISCPTFMDAKDKAFCCDSSVPNVQYCCDVEEYIKTHPALITGVAIALVVIISIITICCCCFCSCCCLARRRLQRGHVYGPVTGLQQIPVSHLPAQTNVVHPPPPIGSPYAPPQPALNPYFR